MVRILLRVGMGILVLLALVYVGDWAVWKIRVVRGGGMGSVEVKRMVVASLKGNKEEYYPEGGETVACSQSLFPWVGGGACWWLQRNRIVLERY